MPSEERNGRLRIVTHMTSPEGEHYDEKHASRCTVFRSTDGLRFAWRESHEGTESHIELTIIGREAVMHRSGEMEGHLCFAEGSRCMGIYHTPYGSFDVETDTLEVSLREQENGGAVDLRYRLYMQGELTSTAHLEMIWRF